MRWLVINRRHANLSRKKPVAIVRSSFSYCPLPLHAGSEWDLERYALLQQSLVALDRLWRQLDATGFMNSEVSVYFQDEVQYAPA